MLIKRRGRMVTHIVLWSLLDTLTEEEKKAAAQKIKGLLEPLKDVIPGVLSLKVVINDLPSSNKDVALIGEYESAEALYQYAGHPAHVEAGAYVKSVTCGRSCMDYTV